MHTLCVDSYVQGVGLCFAAQELTEESAEAAPNRLQPRAEPDTRAFMHACLPARGQGRVRPLQGLIGRALAGCRFCLWCGGARLHHLLHPPVDAADLQAVAWILLLLAECSSGCRLLQCVLSFNGEPHSPSLLSKHLYPKSFRFQHPADCVCTYLGWDLIPNSTCCK